MGRKGEKPQFRIAAVYDTETCNICVDKAANQWRAYPVLYIVNDIRACDLRAYEVGAGRVAFYRHEEDMQRVIDDYIAWGEEERCIPIICAYNLTFDLQPLMYDLNDRWDMVASAQSATSAGAWGARARNRNLESQPCTTRRHATSAWTRPRISGAPTRCFT